jgi:hypothetical protein
MIGLVKSALGLGGKSGGGMDFNAARDFMNASNQEYLGQQALLTSDKNKFNAMREALRKADIS